jgi:hypothetical protein
MIPVWKKRRVVNTGMAIQSCIPRDTARLRDDSDISDTSKSAYRSCRQNISEGWTLEGIQSIPSGLTCPVRMGSVMGFLERHTLSDSRAIRSVPLRTWLMNPFPLFFAEIRARPGLPG